MKLVERERRGLVMKILITLPIVQESYFWSVILFSAFLDSNLVSNSRKLPCTKTIKASLITVKCIVIYSTGYGSLYKTICISHKYIILCASIIEDEPKRKSDHL